MDRRKATLVLAVVLAMMAGLAGGPALASAPAAAETPDPLESFNRQMFHFNRQAVDYFINPLADFLVTWVPAPLRTAGANVYDNLTEPEFIVTNLFKGQTHDAAVSGGRFVVNSTLGLGGILEVANGLGLKRRPTEFGEAVCAAGIPAGPYLVLPLIGPANATSAGLITGFFAVEWYALSLISTLLATADLVVDLSASAASLRHADDVPPGNLHDAYTLQRGQYLEYMNRGCPAAGPVPTVAGQGT